MATGTALQVKKRAGSEKSPGSEKSLEMFACPNPDCDCFNVFGKGNLSVCERMGKDKSIRRLYCDHCGCRFSERRGSLMQYTKMPEESVVRVIKCLTHGCSVEATADICQVDPRSVERLLERAGPRAQDFHRLQLAKLEHPPEVVELDELHAKVARPSAPPSPDEGKKGGPGLGRLSPLPSPPSPLASLAGMGRWAATGFTWPWRSLRGS